MNFRYDINGLRAIAVIAVVLFHFNPAWVPGGFAGVDVFFVISGFLMTSIIFKGLENDKFSLVKFYVARANRIIPALAFLCLVLLVFGWFYLMPLDYKALGKHVASSMGFISNMVYWQETGYFDASSYEKWLLHTWSLSVEWQFYIIYPVLLFSLKRFFSFERIKRLIVVGTVLGFFLGALATIRWPDLAYYLLPTRAWEMMMGGVAFLYPWTTTEQKRKIAEILGLLLIVGSYAFISSSTPWPGYFALLPVLGAYLIIISNQQSSFITNNKAFQLLGKWSYSIYLWHWPIVVFGYYFFLDNWVLYGLALTMIFSFLSFRFIESSKYQSYIKWADLIRVKPFWSTVFLGLLGSVIYFGLYEHTNSPVDIKERGIALAYAEEERQKEIRAGICQFNERGKNKNIDIFLNEWSCHSDDEELHDSKILIFGDSHSADKAMGFRLNGIDVSQIGGAGCPLSPYMAETSSYYCSEIFKLLDKTDFDFVLLSSKFREEHITDSNYIKSIIEYWKDKAKVVVLFSPMPDFSLQFNSYLRAGLARGEIGLERHNKFFESLEFIDVPEKFKIINTFNVLCGDSLNCYVADQEKKDFLMIDGGHLSVLGAKRFITKLIMDENFKTITKHGLIYN